MGPVDWKSAREPNVNQESCPEPLHAPTLSNTEALFFDDLPFLDFATSPCKQCQGGW